MGSHQQDRRRALGLIGLGTIGLGTMGLGSTRAGAHGAAFGGVGAPEGGGNGGGRDDTGVVRLVHMTDTHVQPERRAHEGLLACISHAARQRPDLIVTGGDLIMDAFEATEGRTREQWALFERAWKEAGYAGEVRHTIGNHDIWGWNKRKSATRGDEAKWGKRWALDQLGMESAWHAFDAGGWRVVVLDSVQPHGDTGYIGRLEDEQFEWLRGELEAHRARPTCVVSHIPIASATALMDMRDKTPEGWRVLGGLLMTDQARLIRLFDEQPQVKLALSGHMHRNERLEFRGVTYICNGAVSGNWWKGAHHECHEGYGVVDLHAGGTFDYRYEQFGWKAEK